MFEGHERFEVVGTGSHLTWSERVTKAENRDPDYCPRPNFTALAATIAQFHFGWPLLLAIPRACLFIF